MEINLAPIILCSEGKMDYKLPDALKPDGSTQWGDVKVKHPLDDIGEYVGASMDFKWDCCIKVCHEGDELSKIIDKLLSENVDAQKYVEWLKTLDVDDIVYVIAANLMPPEKSVVTGKCEHGVHIKFVDRTMWPLTATLHFRPYGFPVIQAFNRGTPIRENK